MIALVQHPVEQLKIAEGIKSPMARVERSLAYFDPISLAEMEQVALLDRTDTKYILRVSQLAHVLGQLVDQYRILQINGRCLNHYQTLYFDTPNFAMYRQHHNGLRARYKVRVREYVDSDLAFWEVKRKTNQERTVKSRLRTSATAANMEGQVNAFIDEHTPLDAQELEPKLWNKFLRVTLVSKHHPERLTLDLNLEFGWRNAEATLPGIAIAEVKQEHLSQPSDFIQQIRKLGIRPTRFSKYCAGVYLLYDGVKINNFKPRMRLVEKLMQEEMSYERVR